MKLKNKLFYIYLIVNILYCNTGFSQVAKYASLIPCIETLMEENKVAGLSIAIVENQHIVWARGFGYANKEEKDKVTTTTLFQAASVSKTPVACLVMQLVEQGVYNLDTPINDYLKHWHIDEKEYPKNKVTIRQLLSHTAGVNTHGFNGYSMGDTRPTTLQILNGTFPAQSQPIRLIDKPGYAFHYSGGGYCILQQLLEEHYSQSLDSILTQKVLSKLAMQHSFYQQPLDSLHLLKAAIGYANFHKPLKEKYLYNPEQAAAGLWTTPSDLAMFLIALQKSWRGESTFLKKETMQLMLKPIARNTYLGGDMGLGFFTNRCGRKFSFFGHGGGSKGFASEILAGIDTQYAVVIMMNTELSAPILRKIINKLMEKYWK